MRRERGKIFNLLKPSHTGITFSNVLQESHEFNIINYQDFYSGGGVSIGDINNDGLDDLFFYRKHGSESIVSESRGFKILGYY